MSKLFAGLLLFVFGLIYSNIYAQTGGSIKTYHSNGRVKVITHQGQYNGCGVPIGIDSIYNSTGSLLKTIAYAHSLEKGKGCHDLSTKWAVILYYENGKRKAEQYFVSCYECAPVAIGSWKWYNKAGKIIRNENKTKR